ncbi:MAG: YihY/virulence factor BrkB family protein [Fischerella sp.]|uniref:YihY/virulence factor BrkB family protein n=1 Tax=Fischerella sp. TaxID=1191 RepID=UPI0017DFD74B|nr:YihY/virulence factor BrkB family protein [Fischerella sp.]NWF58943.1 YihY/virulence factor BrkB family protein [Fischerella sp.]
MLSTRFIRFFRHLNFRVLKQVIDESGKHRLFGLAAEMAYNNLLALFPTLVAILTVIGMLEIPQDKVDALAQQVLNLAPEQVPLLIKEFVGQIQLPQSGKVLYISFIVALWVASGAISAAMSAMDEIYQIPPNLKRPFWKAKLVSLLLTIGTISLVLIASFLVFISDLIVELVQIITEVPGTTFLSTWTFFRWLLSLAIIAYAFSIIYRHGPSRWPAGTPIMPGAFIGALLWAVVSRIFRVYVSNFANYNLTYGALSAGIVLLLWLNLSSLVMLIGAELNVTVGKVMRSQKEKMF